MNVLISISYNGRNFEGYQKQKEKRTVQYEIETVLKRIFSKTINTFASGRTDSEVHALNQYVNFYIDDDYDIHTLMYKLNRLLPYDIRVNSIKEVDEAFNARFSSISKTYKYIINSGNRDPFREGLVLDYHEELNFDKLAESAAFFEGEHNFKNFTAKIEDRANFIRTILNISVEKNDDIIEITFVGDGFMKYEVRMIVGNMLAYAANKISKEEILKLLDNNSKRNTTSYCVKGCGLYLVNVAYIENRGIEYNYHSHTYRCGHATGKDEEYVLRAIANGFKRIGFSDHIFLPGIYQKGIRGNYEQLEEYIASVNKLKDKYKDRIEILLGFEAEFSLDLIPYYKELLRDKVDYLICGQHAYFQNSIPHWYTSGENRWEDRLHYEADILGAIESGLFSYICHPDLFLQGITVDNPIIDRISDAICKTAKQFDVPLEINLGGYNSYGKNITTLGSISSIAYPNERFWKYAEKYQNKVVIGVDAHKPYDYDRSRYDLAFQLIEKYHLNYISNFIINKR